MPRNAGTASRAEHDAQVLLMAPALAYTVDKLRTGLARAGFAPTEPAPGVLAVGVDESERKGLAMALREHLTPVELDTCRAVLERNGGRAFGLTSLAHVRALRTFVARFEADWLLRLLREDRLLSAFQPVVHAEDPGRVLGYEGLLRGRLDAEPLVEGDPIFSTAREAGMLRTVDRAGRVTALRDFHRHGLDRTLFVNVAPAALFDQEHRLRGTHEAVQRYGIPREHVVFEVVESERVDDVGHLVRVVRELREQGYRIALDDFGSGFASPLLMKQLAPDYVKLDMGLVRNVDHDPYKQVVVGRLLQLVREVGITNVCEGIETRAEMDWLIENGAQYLQGFAFARPHPVPPAPRLPA